MNRAGRRRCNHLGVSNKMVMDKTLSDVYEQGYKAGMKLYGEYYSSMILAGREDVSHEI